MAALLQVPTKAGSLADRVKQEAQQAQQDLAGLLQLKAEQLLQKWAERKGFQLQGSDDGSEEQEADGAAAASSSAPASSSTSSGPITITVGKPTASLRGELCMHACCEHTPSFRR